MGDHEKNQLKADTFQKKIFFCKAGDQSCEKKLFVLIPCRCTCMILCEKFHAWNFVQIFIEVVDFWPFPLKHYLKFVLTFTSYIHVFVQIWSSYLVQK